MRHSRKTGRTGFATGFAMTAGLVMVVAAALGPGLGVRTEAHEGPEHEIEELTELIEARGATGDLLVERAIEYGLLGRNSEAMRDLEHAVRLDPDSTHARRELARLQFQTGRAGDALETVSQALRSWGGGPVDRAGLHIQRAEILRAMGRLRPALGDCDAALRLHAGNPEWYLLRSDLQRRLGLNRKRLAGIEDGIAATGAGILEIERVEALLDGRRYREALVRIEPELESSRIRCRWLVRRGRARLGLGEKAGGVEDLRAAAEQIEGLLDFEHPDATLLLDQATAWMLLGERDAAGRCHALARDKGGDAAIADRIRELIVPSPRRGKAR